MEDEEDNCILAVISEGVYQWFRKSAPEGREATSASTTDIPLDDESNEQQSLGENAHQTPEKSVILKKRVNTTPPSRVPMKNINNDSSPLPQCSWMPDAPPTREKTPNKVVLQEPNIFPLASPQDVQPIPKVTSIAKRP
ncbi:hypothetical protein RN001_013622 [Aquatica leii]|uniref:Uncharacterized protein n=1 Tax=Aquatica leii TaxID=1421715 RepID=A0AAN7SCH1_9COLE|nr:hypothetical protein RN001_013622 [Aquatica leii]